MLTTTEIKELQVSLGMYNYYAKFLPKYTHVSAPL